MEALCNLLAVSGPSPGPLFCYTDGRLLTHQLLSSSVQSILHLAGLSGSYSGHSFRIGAARKAASPGLPDHLRWFSDAYQCYTRTSAGSLIQVSGQLALQVQYGVCGLLLLGLGASGLLPPPPPPPSRRLWLIGHKPPSLRAGSSRSDFGRVGGGCSTTWASRRQLQAP